jgi:3-hydroxybutyrate dehydrogenase
MQLENKVAIVTGAASGIGKGIAALFAREGAKVAIADLNQRGAEAAAELGGAKRAIGVAVDVTDEAATADCVAQTVAAFGRVDILVSNAGIQTVAAIDQFDSPNGSNSSPFIWTAPS